MGVWLSWLSNLLSLSVGGEFWPHFPCLTLFSSSFIFSSSIKTIHLLLPLDFSSSSHHFFYKKKYFSKLLNLPSSISLNISLDPCLFEHFCHTPIFGETHFSLHQNNSFFQWILFSYFSWQEIWSHVWLAW